MIQIFTPDDLLRYLYQDTNAEETLEIEKALQIDPRLQKEYEQLRYDMELPDELAIAPSEKCINHIMSYARAMNLKTLVN